MMFMAPLHSSVAPAGRVQLPAGCAAAGANQLPVTQPKGRPELHCCCAGFCRYSYHGDLGSRLGCALLAAELLPAVLAGDLIHPQRRLDFATYVPVELCPGVDVFDDPYRCVCVFVQMWGALSQAVAPCRQVATSSQQPTIYTDCLPAWLCRMGLQCLYTPL